jgi:CubicO group peptidase (beta-lactamase class C family)
MLASPVISLPDSVAAEVPTSRIEAQIHKALAEIEQSEMSVVVSFSIGDAPPVTAEFGRFRDDGIPAARTQVDLLSITKSLTAISILKLVDQGRLTLSDTIDLYLTGVPDDKRAITIHQLLTHSSGFSGGCGRDHDAISRGELLDCAFELPLSAEPGSAYDYSNVGYSVLAVVIEERTDKSFEKFLLDDVLAGLELTHTGYESAIDESLSVRSKDGELLADASWGGPKPHWILIGNGGLVSTPGEFLRFRQALKEGEIISLELLKLAQTAHVPEDAGGTSHYGYGVVVQDRTSLGPVVGHNGGSRQYSSEWAELRAFDLTVFAAGYQVDGDSAYSAVKILRNSLRELRD